MAIGLKELRSDLGRYMRQVEAGHGLVVTDRGRPIARIEPIERSASFDDLVRRGLITPPAQPFVLNDQIVKGRGIVSDLVAEQRG
jgi:prevent-host-death family protein